MHRSRTDISWLRRIQNNEAARQLESTHHRTRAAPPCVGEEIDRTLKWLSFIVRPVNEHRAANDQIARHEPPGPAVQTVVAIVSHYKVGVIRNFCGLAINGEMKVGTCA